MAKGALLRLKGEYDLAIEEIDIAEDEELTEKYGALHPVVEVEGGPTLYAEFRESRLRQALEKGAPSPAKGQTRELVLFLDRLIFLLANHWLLLVNAAMGLYMGLPLSAPLLMAQGHTGLANALYFLYSFTCHQMPSRSFFLAGYQVAICQRDWAIYASIFLAGLGFILVRRRLRPLSWQSFVVLLTPLAVDGTTQLLGLRLSTPLIRVVTGGLFGLAVVWFAFPYLEEGFQEIREQAGKQLSKVGVLATNHGSGPSR